MENKKPVYNTIKAFLALKGMKSKALANHLHVTEQTVSKWCTNHTQPSIPQLYAIADVLEISVFELLVPNR